MYKNLSRLGLAVVLVCSSLQAQAVGRLADVTVIDRNSGATLPVYFSKGEYWVAGAPGARYAISIRNKIGERVMAVTSVDGINVVNGATAAWGQTGYVFGAWYNYQITGWRKSNTEVAAFEFAAASDSYAERTGRPHQVGVIGVAVFKERLPEPVAMPTPSPYRQEYEKKESGADDAAPPPPTANTTMAQKSMGAAAPAPSTTAPAEAMAERSRSADATAQSVARPAMPSPKLGTGHGQREDSYVSHTNFERLQSAPNPFPNSDSLSYVPDPPARRY